MRRAQLPVDHKLCCSGGAGSSPVTGDRAAAHLCSNPFTPSVAGSGSEACSCGGRLGHGRALLQARRHRSCKSAMSLVFITDYAVPPSGFGQPVSRRVRSTFSRDVQAFQPHAGLRTKHCLLRHLSLQSVGFRPETRRWFLRLQIRRVPRGLSCLRPSLISWREVCASGVNGRRKKVP